MKKEHDFRFTLRHIALLLLCTLLMLSTAVAEDVCVRVNDRTFSVKTVQKYLDETAANMQLTMGSTVQELFGDAQGEYLEAAAEHFVTVAIVEDKLREKGKDTLSDAEEKTLRDYARDTYEQLWQSVSDALREAYPEETYTDRAVTMTMEAAGYSMDGLYEKARQSLLMERFAEIYCPEAVVTDEQVREFYNQAYVEADRALYENDIPLFEKNVLLSGGTSTFVPEGYFYVKYISLKLSDERQSALNDAEHALTAAEEEAQAAEKTLAQAALKEDDLTEYRTRYQDAQDTLTEAQAALEEQYRLAEADYEPMVSLIRSAMNGGESFESLIEKHSIQPAYTDMNESGFPFHPDSEIWSGRVRAQLITLEKYGDCTEPICTDNNVCIYCRMDDMTSGSYEPDEATWEEMKYSLLTAKQNAAMQEMVDAWRADYDIEMDLSRLVFPEE